MPILTTIWVNMLNEKKIHEQWILLITFYNQRESFTYSLFDTKKCWLHMYHNIFFFFRWPQYDRINNIQEIFFQQRGQTYQSIPERLRKRLQALRFKSKILLSYFSPIIFLFWISAAAGKKKQMKDCGPVRHHFININ